MNFIMNKWLGITYFLKGQLVFTWCHYLNAQMVRGVLSCVSTFYYPPEVRRVSIGVGSIPVAILPSCQDVETIALQLHKY